MTNTSTKQTIEFNDKVVRQFMWASIIWGIVGMLVGVLIAAQLNFHQLNLTSWLSFTGGGSDGLMGATSMTSTPVLRMP